MKIKIKFIAILIIVAMAIALTGCSNREGNTVNEGRENSQENTKSTANTEKEQPVETQKPKDTNYWVGAKGEAKITFEKSYSFGAAFEEADLVVELEIIEWLGELGEPYYGRYTYFNAKIIEEYKNTTNNKYDEIVFKQSGEIEDYWRGYPLFKLGERVLLCLRFSDLVNNPWYGVYGDYCFTIVGPLLTEIRIVEKDGEKFGLHKQWYGPNCSDLQSLSSNNAVSVKVIEALRKQNESLIREDISNEDATVHLTVFPLDKLKERIDGWRKD
jgi:hypothetical protein